MVYHLLNLNKWLMSYKKKATPKNKVKFELWKDLSSNPHKSSIRIFCFWTKKQQDRSCCIQNYSNDCEFEKKFNIKKFSSFNNIRISFSYWNLNHVEFWERFYTKSSAFSIAFQRSIIAAF